MIEPKRTKKPAKSKASTPVAGSGVSIASPNAVAGKKISEGPAQKSAAMTKAEMEILYDMICKTVLWSNAASTLNARSSGAKHIAGNLKRHWTTTLRKRVVDGYSD